MHAPELDPAQHRAEIARRNGVLSSGPVSAEGKARSAQNALPSRSVLKEYGPARRQEAAELAALRAAMLGRWQPLDAAEAHWVEELVFVAWRQRRLRVLEDAVLRRAGEPEAGPALPSLATVIRYRGRLDRDWRRAGEELAALRRKRATMADPPSSAGSPTASTTPRATASLPPSISAADDVSTRGTNEPRHPVPPLPEPARTIPRRRHAGTRHRE